MRDARARTCPSQARMASETSGWKRGVARPATRHEIHAGRPCCTSHLPPEIRRPAPRGVLRAAVGRSSDSWMRQESIPTTSAAASQGHRPSAKSRPRLHLPLRGSAGFGFAFRRTRAAPASLFIRQVVPGGTDDPKIRGMPPMVNPDRARPRRWPHSANRPVRRAPRRCVPAGFRASSPAPARRCRRPSSTPPHHRHRRAAR